MVTLVMAQLVGARLTFLVPTAIFLGPTLIQKGIFISFLGDTLFSKGYLLDYFSTLNDHTSPRKGLFTS